MSIDLAIVPRFAKLLRNSESETVRHYLDVLIKYHLIRCNQECQSNKIICILRPKCPHRRFLNVLITLNFQVKDFPKFCYSQRLKELTEFLNAPDLSLPCDLVIRLDDFLTILSVDKVNLRLPKQNDIDATKYTNVLKKSVFIGTVAFTKNFIVAAIRSRAVITIIDLSAQIVVINPLNWRLDNIDFLKATVEVFQGEFGFSVEIKQELERFLIFTFHFPTLKIDQDDVAQEIQTSNYIIGISEQKIIAEIVMPETTDTTIIEEDPSISVGDIETMFNEVKQLYTKISNKIVSSEKK